MKTQFSLLLAFVCLLIFGLGSCKKTEDPVITPGGTTNPGSNTSVTTTKSAAKEIKTFVFGALSPAVSATIDASAKTIAAIVPNSTDVTKLVPTITLSDKATVSPASGLAQDFSKAVTYTVTAEDGSTQTYMATVTKLSPNASNVCRLVAVVGTSTDGGNKRTYQLDSQNRLSQSKYETYGKNGTVTSSNTTLYSYDADGFLASQITTHTYATSGKYDLKEVGTIYTYQNGRLVKDVFMYAYVDASVGGFSITSQCEYDAQGNVSKDISTVSDGTVETTTIVNGKVTAISSNKATFALNAQGFVTKKTNTDGSYIFYQYNPAGQTTLIENYTAKGVKTGYTTYQYVATTYNTPPASPVPLKGHLTIVPSAYGVYGRTAKNTSYTIDAAGKETKTNETTYTYQADSKGNVAGYTYTFSFPSGSSTITSTTAYTYEYQGCQ